MSCAKPIGFDTLVAWWLGELPQEPAARVEEHLFACARCADRLEQIAALAAGVRAVVKQGRLGLVASASFVEALRQAGLALREYRLDPGGSVNCSIAADDDGVVSRLRAPLAGVRRLDVVSIGGGAPEARLADVPFDARAGEVLMIPSAAWLRAMPAFTLHVRLIAVGEAEEKPIADYTFHHTPS